MSLDPICRRLSLCHPALVEKAIRGFALAQKSMKGLQPFETWRSPDRQTFLYAQGRTTPGTIVTRASAWHSWHQYGLAFDVAIYVDGEHRWSWDFDREAVKEIMTGMCGLEPGPSFEACHFQLTGGLTMAEAQDIAQKEGVLGVWVRVSQLLGV